MLDSTIRAKMLKFIEGKLCDSYNTDVILLTGNFYDENRKVEVVYLLGNDEHKKTFYYDELMD